MSTTLRPEISEDNEYYISKHRYYELKHFCLQYDEWKRARSNLDLYSKARFESVRSSYTQSKTESDSNTRLYFTERIDMVNQAAHVTDSIIGPYILTGVTKELSYEILRVRFNIPCSKDAYYKLYRRFFWILDKIRK